MNAITKRNASPAFLSLDIELELDASPVVTYDDLIAMQDEALRSIAFE